MCGPALSAPADTPAVTTPERPLLRASHRDLARVEMLLREQLAAGRLTIEDFEARVSAAYRARSVGELRAVRQDFIDVEVPEPRTAAAPAPPTSGLGRLATLALAFMAAAVFAASLTLSKLSTGRQSSAAVERAVGSTVWNDIPPPTAWMSRSPHTQARRRRRRWTST